MSRSVVLIGGGEHASVVAEAIAAGGDDVTVSGFVDPRPGAAVGGLRHLGSDAVLATLDDHWGVVCFAAPGSASVREAAVVAADPHLAGWLRVAHPKAWISASAQVGPGAVVLPYAVVHTAAVVGAHAIVNTGAIVEHHVNIGPFAHLGPGALVGGGAVIGAGAFIGMGACVRDHVFVREGAMVGMGAVVVDDVAAGATVIGNPARLS